MSSETEIKVETREETGEDARPAPGRFIVVEGLDRAGKTTQCAMLAKALEAEDHNVLQVRFPDRSTPIGKMLDAYLRREIEMEEHAVHLLFSANRYELKETIETALKAGTDVVCDRYVLSGICYTYARQKDVGGRINSMPDWALGSDTRLPKAHITIMLRINPTAAAKRRGFGEERFEQTEFQKRVQRCMEYYWKHSWASWSTALAEVDGSKGLGAVHRDILAQVGSLKFNGRWCRLLG